MADNLGIDSTTAASATNTSSGFTPDLNVGLHQNVQDQATTTVGDVLNGAVASVVDIGASLWNSVPYTEKVDTADILKRTSTDALQVYQEHPDAIHTASFIGGMVIPMGLATKGMNLLRNGAKGISWFGAATEAGRAAELATVTRVFEEAGAASKEYNAVLRSMYTKTAVNQAIDAVAMEAALVGMYNAHPYMEDYMNDFGKNFGISVAFGGAIGGAIGHIADRFVLREATGAISNRVLGDTVGALRPIYGDMANVTALQSQEINIQRMDTLMKEREALGKNETNDMTFAVAKALKQNTYTEQTDLLDKILSPELRAIEPAQKDEIRKFLVGNPDISGVDSIRLLSKADVESEGLIVAPGKSLKDTPTLTNIPKDSTPMQVTLHRGLTSGLDQDGYEFWAQHQYTAQSYSKFNPDPAARVIESKTFKFDALLESLNSTTAKEAVGLTKDASMVELYKAAEQKGFDGLAFTGPQGREFVKLNPVRTNVEAVYFPELGLYGTRKDAIHYAGASVYGMDADALAKALPRNFGKIPNLDSSIELVGKSAPEAQREYIAAMARVDSMDVKDLAKLHISETDGPLLNAVVTRMMRDPEAAKLVIQTSDRSPVYKRILEQKTEQLIADGKITTGPSGPTAFYTGELDRIGEQINRGTYHPREFEAKRLLENWIGGDKLELQRAATEWQARHQQFAKGLANSHQVAEFERVYNSKESQALRESFNKIADSDGNVLLYRGVKNNDIKGGNALDSYTTHIEKAAQFIGSNRERGVKLYKVPVEDIVAGFKDVGGGEINSEIIVKASARPVEAELSASGKIAFQKEQEAQAGKIINTTTTTEQLQLEGGKKSGMQELQNMLLAQKQDALDTLIAQGLPVESIAIKTNTSVENVRAYMHIKQMPDMGINNLIQPETGILGLNFVKNMQDAREILDPTKMPLVINGNVRKNSLYLQNHIGADNNQMHNMNKLSVNTLLRGSGSIAAREIADLLDEFGPALDMVRQQIGKVNNELAGSAFFNSFDFFSRKMGDVGPVASLVGKQVQEVGNRVRNRVVEPIKDAMVSLTKDPAGRIEFNAAMDINARLGGWRMWGEDGKLYQKVPKLDETGKTVTVLEAVKVGGKDYQVQTPAVLDLIKKIQNSSPELRDLKNTSRRILGQADIADIGFWVPSFNPVNKYIAYVHDTVNGQTSLLWAKTEAEYIDIVKNYRQHLIETGQEHVQVYTKQEQKYWSALNGRLDVINMARADQTTLKSGSTGTNIVKSHQDIFTEIAGGYQHYISAEMRNLTDIVLSDITDPLRQMSLLNKGNTANQPFDTIKKMVTQPKDSAAIVHNTLLGNQNLGEYAGWQSVNSNFEIGLTLLQHKLAEVYDVTIKPLTRNFLGGKKEITDAALSKIDYEKVAAEMEKRGIYNPYACFDDAAAKMFGLSRIEDHKDTGKRIIYASNALAATMALRVGEIAQPLVNAMSLPILTSLAIADKMPETFLGVQKATAKVSGTQIMFEGARAANSPMFKDLNARWEKAGYFTPLVSEANDLMRASRQFETGMVAKIENALDHKLIQTLSKPADMAESLTRKIAMNTGAVLAKRLYPELDEVGVTIFARNFMDKAIGNFHAAQRPVFFQGTMGVALGLFQTYSLTLAQSIYRSLELKNFKALGTAALLQSSIFGTKALPGFDTVSQYIGNHFSEDHFDLATGTYRAIGEPLANMILYGMPSNLTHASFTSRGNADFRPPVFNMPVAVNTVQQIGGMISHVATSVQNDAPDIGRSLVQSLSLQNMSRPIARGAELATGYSITQKGTTVQVPEEVWTPTGIFARAISTRPLEDEKLRETEHMRREYAAYDSQNRQQTTDRLRTAIRGGTLNDEKVAKLASDYLKNGGSPAGWRSSVNTAIATTDTSGRETLMEKLKPTSALQFMIDHNLD